MAHRMARGVASSLDAARIDGLLRRWAEEGRRDFIVWSGFWLPIVERYRSLAGGPLNIDCCRIDAVVSPSFRAHQGLAPDAREIWLWNWNERRTVFEIPVSDAPPLPFSDRDHRLVVHGGGWGIGTYATARETLGGTAWACDNVVHAPAEAVPGRQGDRAFMVDPAWRTWHRGSAGHTFPPFAELGGARDGAVTDDHALQALIRRSKAIVSKPGGGTLIDALSAATPVILLAPLGDAEERNGALWEHLGFGVSFATWADSGFSEAVLAGLHVNLLRRARNGPDYPRFCVERLRQRACA
jgi:hypothetical protein